MLFYTGADDNNKAQSDAGRSLGGYISFSQIPNGSINNLFPAINREYFQRGIIDVRLIAFQAPTNMTAASIWTEKGALSAYNIAVVTPAQDSCNHPLFEKIATPNSLPYQATLSSHETEANKLTIGNLTSGAWIGIWIQRVLDSSQFNALDGVGDISLVTDAELITLMQAAESTAQDSGNLIIDWS
jgi:hypothetical protein